MIRRGPGDRVVTHHVPILIFDCSRHAEIITQCIERDFSG